MKRLIFVLLICLLLPGCAGENYAESTTFAMDTVITLQVWGKDAQTGVDEITALVSRLQRDWSATEGNSILGRLNRGESVTWTDAQQALLDRVEALSVRTGGAFDPHMRSVSLAWGFLNQAYTVPTEADIAAALAERQWDLGAAVKGYAGQQAAELLAELEADRALLNLGGNVQTYGEKPDGTPWQIAIQNPAGGDYVGVVSVTGTASIVTSGDYQRYFERDGVKYHHILDPKTGWPADSGLSGVTVICRDGLTADCLSTALFVMGLEEGAEFWRESDDFEAVFITSAGEIYATEGAALSGCEYEVICREK